QMLDGIGLEHAPPLRGYVSTKPKPLSEVLLVSDYGEPLLARWRQGLGQAVAFTSDVKNRWASDWLHWPGYQQFWAQLVRSPTRRWIHTAASWCAPWRARRVPPAANRWARSRTPTRASSCSPASTSRAWRARRKPPAAICVPSRHASTMPRATKCATTASCGR